MLHTIVVNLDKEFLKGLKVLSNYFGLKPEETARIVLESTLLFSDRLVSIAKEYYAKDRENGDTLEFFIASVLDKGLDLLVFTHALLNYMKSDAKSFTLESIDWLDDMGGIYIKLSSLVSRDAEMLIQDIDIKLQSDGHIYIVYTVPVDTFKEKTLRDQYNKLRERIDKAINSNEFFELENNLMECSDYGEVDIDLEEAFNEGDLYLKLKYYSSSWNCLPNIDTVNDIFRLILRIDNH